MLLTDEEICKLEEDCVVCYGHDEHDVAKAQAKRIAEWGNETCTDRSHSGTMRKRECGFCWQTLLEETK